MGKIDRYNGNLEAFAADALSTERTIFWRYCAVRHA